MSDLAAPSTSHYLVSHLRKPGWGPCLAWLESGACIIIIAFTASSPAGPTLSCSQAATLSV